MPKSKRTRTTALTQTEKRSTRDHKSKYIEEVRDAVDKHESIYLFSYENMRSSKFKNIRLHFRDEKEGASRIFLGKNKLLQIALGRTTEDEYADNLQQIGKRITGGSIGLLFTSRDRSEVETYFASMKEPDFARAGAIAEESISVTNSNLITFPVSMMEPLRKSGMPVEIKEGKIILRDGATTWQLCKEGEKLSAEKCKLLSHFGMKLSTFKVDLVGWWSGGEFELIK